MATGSIEPNQLWVHKWVNLNKWTNWFIAFKKKKFLDFVLSSDSSEPDSSEPTQKHLFNLSQLFKLT